MPKVRIIVGNDFIPIRVSGHSIQNSDSPTEAANDLDSIKWKLRHGQVDGDFKRLDRIEIDLQCYDEGKTLEPARKLLKAVCEFQTYIKTNKPSIPTMGTATATPSRSPRLWPSPP